MLLPGALTPKGEPLTAHTPIRTPFRIRHAAPRFPPCSASLRTRAIRRRRTCIPTLPRRTSRRRAGGERGIRTKHPARRRSNSKTRWGTTNCSCRCRCGRRRSNRRRPASTRRAPSHRFSRGTSRRRRCSSHRSRFSTSGDPISSAARTRRTVDMQDVGRLRNRRRAPVAGKHLLDRVAPPDNESLLARRVARPNRPRRSSRCRPTRRVHGSTEAACRRTSLRRCRRSRRDRAAEERARYAFKRCFLNELVHATRAPLPTKLRRRAHPRG